MANKQVKLQDTEIGKVYYQSYTNKNGRLCSSYKIIVGTAERKLKVAWWSNNEIERDAVRAIADELVD